VHDGQIGDIVGLNGWYNTLGLWRKERQPEWSDLENQMRNWLYYTWLSGDHIVEQAVHNIDALNWIMRGNPVSAVATGGRQVRTGPEWGHIYDPLRRRLRIPERRPRLDVHAAAGQHRQEGRQRGRRHQGPRLHPAEVLHHRARTRGRSKASSMTPTSPSTRHMIESLRAGTPLNELKQIAESSLAGILGREAAYQGGVVTWEQALAMPSLMPARCSGAPCRCRPVPMPGTTA
jgi:predicted dehydrogenase